MIQGFFLRILWPIFVPEELQCCAEGSYSREVTTSDNPAARKHRGLFRAANRRRSSITDLAGAP
jgi:hypothetical protein